MDQTESLGTVIMLARRRVELTQQELAEKVGGVSAPDVSRWERNRRLPKVAQLMKVAEITGDDRVLDLRGRLGVTDLGERRSTCIPKSTGQKVRSVAA